MAGNPGIISGKVHDERGKPIADARIYFSAGPVPFPEIVSLTNEDGSFLLTAPLPGRYVVECVTEKFAPHSSVVTVAQSQTVYVDIELKSKR